MKYYIVILVFLFVFSNSFAQTKYLDYSKALKIYNLSSYQKISSSSSDSFNLYNSSHSEFQILKPTIAYTWKGKNNNFNEVELTTLIMKKTDDANSFTSSNGLEHFNEGATIFNTSVSLRYEYIVNFFKTSNCKLLPSLGIALNPYYNQSKVKPKTTQTFPTSIADFGLKYSLIPRITWYCSSKCFFDFNIPLNIFEVKNTFTTIRNPSIPNRNQTTSTSDFQLFPKQINVRLGFGIKI